MAKNNQCLRSHTRALREITLKKLLPKNGSTKPTKCYQSGKPVLFRTYIIDALKVDEDARDFNGDMQASSAEPEDVIDWVVSNARDGVLSSED